MAWKIVAFVLVAPVAVYMVLAAIYGRVGLLERLFGPAVREPVDFARLDLKPSPNQYLVCPAVLCVAKPHLESPVFEASLDELREAWFRMIARQPRVSLLSSNPAVEQYEYQALTPVIHFPDAVTVRLLPADEGNSTLAIYGRSHYGRSDLGENRRRTQRWLDRLRTELNSPSGPR